SAVNQSGVADNLKEEEDEDQVGKPGKTETKDDQEDKSGRRGLRILTRAEFMWCEQVKKACLSIGLRLHNSKLFG
ncbi:hypothetical protein THAOC_07150, partial [Thalassiosira oceanica]